MPRRTKMSGHRTRRRFLCECSALVASGAALASSVHGDAPLSPPPGFRSLFDGKTLAGWHALPRAQAAKAASGAKADGLDSFYQRSLKSVGKWTVEEGVIIGAQDPPGSGLGGYLVSDEMFGDF